MQDEGSLLEIVQKKELELKARCDEVSREMENSLVSAKKDAESIIQDTIRRGKEEASKIIEEETAHLDRDLEDIRADGRRKRDTVQARASAMMDKAVDYLVKAAKDSS
jgi:vacuolar-type H+-ATPase subunit H